MGVIFVIIFMLKIVNAYKKNKRINATLLAVVGEKSLLLFIFPYYFFKSCFKLLS